VDTTRSCSTGCIRSGYTLVSLSQTQSNQAHTSSAWSLAIVHMVGLNFAAIFRKSRTHRMCGFGRNVSVDWSECLCCFVFQVRVRAVLCCWYELIVILCGYTEDIQLVCRPPCNGILCIPPQISFALINTTSTELLHEFFVQKIRKRCKLRVWWK